MNEKQQFISSLHQIISKTRPEYNCKPITGNVGQDVIGYFTDPYGRTIRILPKYKDDTSLGPGCYNPDKPKPHSRSIKISSTGKRSSLVLNKFKVGPSDHSNIQIESFNNRKSKKSDKKKLFEKNRKPKNLETPQQKDSDEPRNPEPKRRYPAFTFNNSPNTRQFLSKESRELFEIKEEQESKSKPLFRQIVSLNAIPGASSVFKSHTERFVDINTSITPSSTQYHVPTGIDTSKGHCFGPLFPEGEPLPQFTTPGPGHYSVKSKSIVSKSRPSPSFATRIPRQTLPISDGPSPVDYQKPTTTMKRTASPLIHPKLDRPGSSWCEPKETPGPGIYNDGIPKKATGGFIPVAKNSINSTSIIGSGDLLLVHGDMIKKTYNAKIYRSNKK